MTISALSSLFKTCYSKLSEDCAQLKSDLGQARSRLAAAVIFFIYFLSAYLLQGSLDLQMLALIVLFACYSSSSLWLFYAAMKNQRSTLGRRFGVIAVDNIVVTITLSIVGAMGLPLFFVYVWITALNGYRFGVNYLIYSALIGLLSLVGLYISDTYWSLHSGPLWLTFFVIIGITLTGSFLVKQQMQGRRDSEHEQAFIRIVISCVYMAYFFYFWFFGEHHDGISDAAGTSLDPFFVAMLVVLLSITIFLLIMLRRQPSGIRRTFGMLVDLGATTYVLANTSEIGAPMLGVYLWVTMGNGFRYGVKSLYYSTAVSVLGFVVVVAVNSFWQSHLLISLSFGVLLLALPLYMSILLRKLNAAIEHANAANQAKTQFLANMSHELRTPLNAVIGISDLLIDANINEYQRRLTTRIQSSAHLLLGVIEHILDISKIEAGRIELQRRTFDLYALIYDVATVFEMQAETKGLRFLVTVSPEVPVTVVGDANRVKQILVNLLGNACKFTEKGAVHFRVYVRSETAGKSVVCFEVEDTGIGIVPDRQKSIFEPFVQADASITRRYGGTGLGMSISKQLVEAMGGDISMLSAPAEGTTFWVNVPFAYLTEPQTWDRNDSSRVLKVLVVGASAGSTELSRSFKNWNFSVQNVETVADMCGIAAELPRNIPALIVIDESEFDDRELEVALPSLLESVLGSCELALLANARNLNQLKAYEARGFNWVVSKPAERRHFKNIAHYVSLKYADASNVISLADHYTQRQGRKLQVLVSEDNKINQMVMRELLSKIGHQVTVVEDGEAALDMLDERAFDLAIIDVNMPKVSGLEVVKVCRFRSDLRDLPIIVLSADATPEMEDACRTAGATEFVTKPFDAKHLLELIAKLSGARKNSVKRVNDDLEVTVTDAQDVLLDFDALKRLMVAGVDAKFLRSLQSEFIGQGRRQLPLIKNAALVGNLSAWKNELHSLKGAAGYLGAVRLTSLCKKAESMVSAGSFTGWQSMIAAVEEAFDASCVALSDYIDQCK